MQYSSNEDNPADLVDPAASENLPLAGCSSDDRSDEVHVNRYVSEVNCKCLPESDVGGDDKDVAGVYDSWLSKLAAESTATGSTDELIDGSGCLSLTEPSSSHVGSIVTVISQNRVTGDCCGSECSADAADDLMAGAGKDKCMDHTESQSAVKPNSHSRYDGDTGRCFTVLSFHIFITLPSFG